MSLEEYIPSEWVSESWASWAEKASEVSEKFKESVKKASSWIARTRKDEKKAKKQDMLLASFLVKIILNKKYDSLLEKLFELIDLWVPSNFLLWVMSLVYIDISNEIRKNSAKKPIEFSYFSENKIEFSDLNKDIRARITSWIEDIYDSVVIEYSSLMTKRLVDLLDKEEKIIDFIALVFWFFLKDINIQISEKEAKNIAEFIVSEVLKNLKTLKLEKI